MRILVVTNGLEPSLHLTVVGLADRGHQVRVVGALSPDELDPVDRFRLGRSLRVSGGESGGPLRRAGRLAGQVARSATVAGGSLRAVTTRTRRSHGLGRPFRLQMATHLPLLAEPADVVYFEAANVMAQHGPVLDRLGPRIVMCTGSDIKVLPHLSHRLAEVLPAVFAGTSRVLCRSQDLRYWALRRGAPPERTAVLYTACDTTLFAPAGRPPRPGDALRLVSVGRLHWVKGYEFAVQALSLVRALGHDVNYTIVGADEGAGDAVNYAVAELGLGGVVTMTGPKTRVGVRDALARADVFLLPSVGEGLSRAALEAMAMGLPVVTTDAGGMTELVDDGVEGLVVPRRDPRALAEAIATLVCDPPLRSAMAERALARAQHFDARTHLDRLEKILVEVADIGNVPMTPA